MARLWERIGPIQSGMLLWVLLPITVAGLCLPCFDSQVVGTFHDDGIYVISAKMLAAGKGFILPNLAGAPPQIKYPILYPLILALGWKISPQFPQNIAILHTITTLFFCFSIPLLVLYLRRCKQRSRFETSLIVLATTTCFYSLFYCTSLMSEAPYFFLSLLTLFCGEKWIESQKPIPVTRLIGLTLFSILTFHTRTVGIALMVAMSTDFLLKKKKKAALIYSFLCLVFAILPWFWWVRSHTPKVTDINFPIAFLYGGYGVEFGIHSLDQGFQYLQAIMLQGLYPLMSGTVQVLFGGIPYWLETVLQFPLGYQLCILFISGLMLLGIIRHCKNKAWSLSGLYLGFYILLLSLWIYPNQATRFLMVVQPWLWLALFDSGKMLWQDIFTRLKPKPVYTFITRTMTLMILGFLTFWPAFQGYTLLKTMRQNHRITPQPQYATLWAEYQEAFAYIQKNTPVNTTIASIWDPTIYLYTQRKTFGIFGAALMPEAGQITPLSFQRLYKSLKAYQVAYILDEPYMLNQQVVNPKNPVVEGLQHYYPQGWIQEFESSGGKVRLYRLK